MPSTTPDSKRIVREVEGGLFADDQLFCGGFASNVAGKTQRVTVWAVTR
jgi:hypothetical protein